MKGYSFLAGADIGSNAIRVVLASVRPSGKTWHVKQEQALRLPVRLGEDVFSNRKVGSKATDKLLVAMRIYQDLIELYNPVDHRVCATSALREAKNSAKLIDKVRKRCNVKIELIDGVTEANLIYRALIESGERSGLTTQPAH